MRLDEPVLIVSRRRAPTMLCTFPADLKSLSDDLWVLLTGGHLIQNDRPKPAVALMPGRGANRGSGGAER